MSSRPVRKTRMSPGGCCKGRGRFSRGPGGRGRMDEETTHLEVDVEHGLDGLHGNVVGRLVEVGDLDRERLAFEPNHDGVVEFGQLALLLVPPRALGRRRLQDVVAGLDAGRRDGRRGRLRVEEVDERLGLDGGRRDDDAELGADAADLFEDAEEEVGVAAALVRLVDHDDRVAREERVEEDLAEEHAVGEVDDLGVGRRERLEAHAVANLSGG